MHHINSWNSSDLPVYRKQKSHPYWMGFCFAASFYFSSTTLYCTYYQHFVRFLLLLLPQRYEFSSKSQHAGKKINCRVGCCCYRKGTNFQANHNSIRHLFVRMGGCCCYRKGTNFQANHNSVSVSVLVVVVATAKVRIFKQITTQYELVQYDVLLLLLPQRYEFSSKSQLG